MLTPTLQSKINTIEDFPEVARALQDALAPILPGASWNADETATQVLIDLNYPLKDVAFSTLVEVGGPTLRLPFMVTLVFHDADHPNIFTGVIWNGEVYETYERLDANNPTDLTGWCGAVAEAKDQIVIKAQRKMLDTLMSFANVLSYPIGRVFNDLFDVPQVKEDPK